MSVNPDAVERTKKNVASAEMKVLLRRLAKLSAEPAKADAKSEYGDDKGDTMGIKSLLAIPLVFILFASLFGCASQGTRRRAQQRQARRWSNWKTNQC